MSKVPGVISINDLPKTVPKFNFTSALNDKLKMEPKKMIKHDEIQDVCVRGKKRRLDHLTWEEKIAKKEIKKTG